MVSTNSFLMRGSEAGKYFVKREKFPPETCKKCFSTNFDVYTEFGSPLVFKVMLKKYERQHMSELYPHT